MPLLSSANTSEEFLGLFFVILSPEQGRSSRVIYDLPGYYSSSPCIRPPSDNTVPNPPEARPIPQPFCLAICYAAPPIIPD